DAGRDVAPGEPGHVVLSNLVNRATVLLNYRIGDMATALEGVCDCGRTLPLMTGVEGRSDDLLRLPGGRIVQGLNVVAILQKQPDVRQVQIVHRAPDRFVLRVVPVPGSVPDSRELAAAFLAGLGLSGAEAHVAVESTTAIPPDSRGKV